MVHRKSIPLQSLLYFNSFLEFSYFYSLRNFQIVSRNVDYLKIFLQNFFTEFLGFSVNRLRIDFCFDSVELFIDFLIIGFRIRTGVIFRKRFKKLLQWRSFYMKFLKKGGILHKWSDAFLYQIYLLYHKRGLRFFRYSLCSVLGSVSVFCLLPRCFKNYFSNNFVISLEADSLYLFIKNIFIYCFILFNFDVKYLLLIYCFIILCFSAFYKRLCLFKHSVLQKLSFKGVSKSVFQSENIVKNFNFCILDFVYFYIVYSKFFIKRSFIFIYFLRFFKFLFYQILDIKQLQFVIVYSLNFFQYILYYWHFIMFNSFLAFSVKFNFIISRFVYFNVLLNVFKVHVISKYLPISRYNRVFSFYSVFERLRIKFLLKSFYSLYGFVSKGFINYANEVCSFNFVDFLIKFLNMHFFFLFLNRSCFRTFYFKVCRSIFLTNFGNDFVSISTVPSYLSLDFLESYKYFRIFHKFVKYRLFAEFGFLQFGSLALLLKNLRIKCLFSRGYRVCTRFNKFFDSNCASLGFIKKYTKVSYFGGKPFIYFYLYFVYQLDFVYKILKDCGFLNFFIFYIIFFFKNWKFLNVWFYKFFKVDISPTRVGAFSLKKRIMLYRICLESFFYRKFSFNFRSLLVGKNSKIFKYFYQCYTKNLFFFFKQRITRCFFFGYIFKYIKRCCYCYKGGLRPIVLANSLLFLKDSFSIVNSFKVLKKIAIGLRGCNFSIINLNIGLVLFELLHSILVDFNGQLKSNKTAYIVCHILLYKWHFQLKCDFRKYFIRSFLYVFNLKYFKSLCALYCFFFFGLDFIFKFYLNLYFVNYIFFCEFFHSIFNINFVFNFFFLKMHLTSYRFGGFLGLYLLIFKFSKLEVSVCGLFILDYIYDIFFYIFITNRYTSIRYNLGILSQMFNDFLQVNMFCGFNFKIKGRLSKKTQRKQCFVLRQGSLKWTEFDHNLFVGKRILTTHIGSVSLQLAVQLKKSL